MSSSLTHFCADIAEEKSEEDADAADEQDYVDDFEEYDLGEVSKVKNLSINQYFNGD